MTLREVERDAVLMGRRWVHDLLFADWGLKLLALAITFGLWFAVTGQRVPTTARLRKVPLFFVLPPDMEISNEPREEVDVTLRGSKRALDTIKSSDVALSYDASIYKPGERVLQLSPNNITLQLPEGVSREGVTIERVEPGSLPLRLERRIEREVPVEPMLEGKVAAGYEVLGAQAQPAMIRVRGPESHVKALEKAPTETILLEDRAESFMAAQIAIDIQDQRITPLEAVVNVFVKISETQATKRLTGVVLRSANGDLLSAPRTIEVRGARSVIENLRAPDLSITLDAAGDGTTSPRLVLPPHLQGRVELISTNPAN
ncbi:MAG: CdaR family protein [Pyrinomonadaceae bacterium]